MHIFMDESSLYDGQYMVIGGIWIPDALVEEARIVMKDIRYRYGVKWEFKWRTLSAVKIGAFKDVIDYFFAMHALTYRCIVIDKHIVDYATYHDNDKELGFYKFYYFLISRNLNPCIDYHAFLDNRHNKRANRLSDLKSRVNYWCNNQYFCDHDILRAVEPRDSKDDELIQMADIFTGAVAGKWNNSFTSTAKSEICDYIAKKIRKPTLRVSCARNEFKFNIWQWKPYTK